MNSMYKKGGKASKKPMKKESFMEESKELHFGAPGVTPPMKKKMMGGKYEMGGLGDGTTTKKNLLGQTVTTNRSGLDYDRTVTRKDGSVAKQSGVKTEAFNAETGTSDTDNFYKKKYDRSGKLKSSESTVNKYIQEDKNSKGEYDGNSIPYSFSAKANGNGKVTRENGYKTVDNPDRLTINESSSSSKKDLQEKARRSRASFETGGKSMAPGGGGRFEALVNKLKSKGKSADQAKGIAASAGRAKYGKSKFQAMAAAGRKKG
jgi:hypothetical protein